MDGEFSKPGAQSENALRLIRLRRLAENRQIPARLVELYASQIQSPPAENLEVKATQDEVPSERQAATAAGPAKVLTERGEEAELILRRLGAAEESWENMKPYVHEVFERWPRPEIAAKVAEMAFLHGSPDDLIEVLESYRESCPNFYFLVDPNVREYIVLRLWMARKEAVLNHFLHNKAFRSYLLPVEHFFVFWSLFASPKQKKAFEYFQRHQFELQKALNDFGKRLKLNPGYFYLTVGRLALAAREEVLARQLLEKIKREDAEFPQALDLLIKFDVELDENGLCPFGRKLSFEKKWENRVKLLHEFFVGCQRIEGVRHQERNALNHLLYDPLRWFPQNAQAWGQVAKLLVKFADLAFLLPNILQVYRSRRFEYESPGLERALWEPLLRIRCGDLSVDAYWRCFGFIHQYVALGGEDENLIWKARRQMQKASELCSKPLPETWSDIHSKLLGFVSRSFRYEEKQRLELLVKLKVAGSYLDVQSEDIRKYLDQMGVPNYDVLSELQNLVRQREDWQLELDLIQRLAYRNHYRNQDLNRLWQLSRQLNQFDLAWRVASVVQARQVLHPDIARLWGLTADRRQDRNLKAVSDQGWDVLLGDMKEDHRKFLKAVIAVGPLLPELLAVVSKFIKTQKRPLMKSNLEKEFERVVQRMPWLLASKKIYRHEGDMELWAIPPFADILPENRWTAVFMNLADRSGILTWRWQLSFLYGEIEGLLIRLSRGKDVLIPSRVGKWLRNLTPAQRKSWYDLGIFAKRLSDDEAQVLLGMLMARLATCMCHLHSEALDSLAAMGAPIAMRWDLERFILSPGYGRLRAQLGTAVRLEVPVSLPDSCLSGPVQKHRS